MINLKHGYQLVTAERETLIHALQVAAQTFEDHVKNFERTPASPFITGQVLKQFCQLFSEYRDNALKLHEKLEHAKTIIIDDGEEEVR